MKLLLSIVQTSSIEVVPYFRHSASLRRNSGQSVSSRRPNAPMPPAYVIFSGTQRPHAAGQDSERGIVESSRRPKAPMPAARASLRLMFFELFAFWRNLWPVQHISPTVHSFI